MKKSFVLALVCTILLSAAANPQTRRRTTPRRRSSTAAAKAAAEKTAAELQAGRQALAAQIKTLSQFLYLYGGVVKGFESVDSASGNEKPTPAAIEQNQRSQAKVRESIRNVRVGLDKIETQFRFTSALTSYYPRVAGVGSVGVMAERQAAAGQFDEAGRSLLRILSQLADALAAIRG